MANMLRTNAVQYPQGRIKTSEARKRSKLAENSTGPIVPYGELVRTRRLLLAALRVWELKHRICP